MEDETEADLNGLLIYLSLGYPRIEAYQSFLTTFKDTPTQENKERFAILNQFITNFERNKFCTIYTNLKECPNLCCMQWKYKYFPSFGLKQQRIDINLIFKYTF